MRSEKDNIKDQTQIWADTDQTKVSTQHHMKIMKYNTYHRKRQGQHKRPNTNVDSHGQDKTEESVQHQPCGQAFKYASL